MGMSYLLRIASLFASTIAQTYINDCGGSFNITKWVISPPNPQAGDTVTLNATGVELGSTPLTGGTGVINAYLFGAQVFTAPFNTCNETQIDVLGFATGILDAPVCGSTLPINQGQQGKIGFVLPIPGAGSGLGQLNIVLNASDAQNNFACAFLPFGSPLWLLLCSSSLTSPH
jgi:hypothetical protein